MERADEIPARHAEELERAKADFRRAYQLAGQMIEEMRPQLELAYAAWAQACGEALQRCEAAIRAASTPRPS